MREETRRDTSNDLPLKWEFQRSDTSVMGTSPRDRRVFQRVETRGLPLEFDVQEPGGFLRHRRRSSRSAEVIDVSVSGAQVMVATHGRWQPASMVTIRHDGSVGKALIRWEAPGPTPDTRLYGVEFLELDAPLRQYLGRPVDERRGHMPQYQFTSPIARASKFT